MKIAIVSTFIGQKSGGAEMSAYYLCKLLSKKNKIFAITVKVKEDLSFKYYSLNLDRVPNIVVMIGNSLLNYITYKKILNVLKEESPDIIHIQDFPLLYASMKAANILKIPIVISVRDFRHQCNLSVCANDGKFKYNCSKKQYKICLQRTFKSKTKYYKVANKILFSMFYNQKVLFQSLIKKIDGVISVSDFVKSCLLKSGVSKYKIDTIYVPKPVWSNVENHQIDKNVLFAAGLFVKAKGFQTLIKAVNILKNDFSDIKLRIAGDGPYRKKLVDLVNKLDLQKNIIFLGKINSEQIKKEYLKANVILQSSIVPESLSRIIFESLSVNKPLISADSGGNKELVRDNETGLLVLNRKSPKEFAKKIRFMLENPKLALKMGLKGSKLINKVSSDEIVLKKHLEKYKKTIEEYKYKNE